MKKLLYALSLILISIFIANCSEDSHSYTPQEGAQYFALFRLIPDVYQEQMYDFIRDNSIKTISIVAKDIETERKDSLTYLEFDNEGKLIRRTTIECTTLGCLPYTNKQVYSYKSGRLDRINQFTFVDNSKSMLYYWNLADTSKMNLFDWEDYSYKGDTVFSESAISRWTFVKDSIDNLVYRKLMAKSTKQIIENEFIYSDSTIQISSKSNSLNENDQKVLSVGDDAIKISEFNNGKKNLIQHWHMDSKGMPHTIDTYHNGEQKRIITFVYTYH